MKNRYREVECELIYKRQLSQQYARGACFTGDSNLSIALIEAHTHRAHFARDGS